MKTQKYFIGIFMLIIINIIGCQSNKDNKLIGKYSVINEGVSWIEIAELNDSLRATITEVYSEPYKIGQVLFRGIKIHNDSTGTAKGLFIKKIYKTENIAKQGWERKTDYSPTHYYTYYEQEEVFDHYEYILTDYTFKLTKKIVNNIPFEIILFTPSGEGEEFTLLPEANAENYAIANAREDSIQWSREAHEKSIKDSLKRLERAKKYL